ncbi:glutamyl-tRNA amidotransferase [Campylobacter pinnipediorum]|uniref:glutamyl-tRNA amidotransferase n=1 Tax=Campylobacter pinnipediorum TaxID=1965231 RepID=UPI00084DF3FF|nr:glutamyl-tRNA amidotransferase [Campylobacter pinnipediorum]AQW81378.1 hypothetical protein CPIN17260_1089 [Campylobacter pinnipediorum subsp. pinnipediorum]AQW83004.1 hypothetical protein CPIN17261_1000 [Campylobacter pinnipediorum subsp. pinnipediorum]
MRKITQELKDKIIAEYKTGASKNQLSIKYDVSVGFVYNLCKDVEQNLKELVKTEVAIKTELAKLNEKEVKAFHEVVEERTKHLIYFQNIALANQRKANELLEMADTIQDVEAHSRITARNKETVLGKEANTIINNTNAQQNQTKLTIVRKDLKDE